MKKVILAALVLVALAAGGFVFFKKGLTHHTRATELVPAEAIFFAQLPDLRRTWERWPKTALAQIGKEPEMQAFLAKPRAAAPQMKLWDAKLAQLERVLPGEAFMAVTSIEGNEPHFLAGFSFSGRKADVDALLAEGRAELKSNWPAGKSDVTMQGKTPIETFSFQDKTVGEAYCEDWYFVSNDLKLLRQTIDAAGQGLGPKGLAASDLFRKSTARIPADGEMVVFTQVATLTDRLVSLLVASGQAPDPKQLAELKKIQALALSTKFEDAQMRDTLFILSPGNTVESPLAKNALAFSNADTIFTYSTGLPATLDVSDSLGALSLMLPSFGALQKGLADKGLKLNDLVRAFGPEFGMVLNWTPGAAQPSALLALDVRNPAMAKSFVDVYTGGLGGGVAWAVDVKDGVTVYQDSASGVGFPSFPPATLALTDRYLVIGLSQPEVLAGLEQLKKGQSAIAATPAFSAAAKSVTVPTAGFGYLDLKAFFERSYGTLRAFLAMSLAFGADSGKYIDAGKLPGTEAISKHLAPTVYSQSVSEDGTLIESVGPLTFNQVFVGVIGGAVAAAFPMIENAISGGLKLDPSLLQLTPPAAVPPKSTPPLPAQASPPDAAPTPQKPATPAPPPPQL